MQTYLFLYQFFFYSGKWCVTHYIPKIYTVDLGITKTHANPNPGLIAEIATLLPTNQFCHLGPALPSARCLL